MYERLMSRSVSPERALRAPQKGLAAKPRQFFVRDLQWTRCLCHRQTWQVTSCRTLRILSPEPNDFPVDCSRNSLRTVNSQRDHSDVLRSYSELSGNAAIHAAKDRRLFQLGRGSLDGKRQIEPSVSEIENSSRFHILSRKIRVPVRMSKKEEDVLIGKRISALMKSLGMNQTTFASAINTRPSTVSKWASGHNRPSPDVLVRIARLADDIDKIFFLEWAGIPESYLGGAPMISEIRNATTKVIAQTLSEIDNTSQPLVMAGGRCTVHLLKTAKKLGAPNEVQTQDIDASFQLPMSWFPRGAEIQAVKFPQTISPFVTGAVIALVDVSRRDPDRLAGSVVVVRTPTATEPMTLRKDGETYLLVPLQEDANHQVRVLRTSGPWSIVGRVVKWIGDAPPIRK